MGKVVTFGELMMRLAPESYLRFVQSERYVATFGGAEANVAVSLANFGEKTVFVSRLPIHEIGQAGVNSLRRYGVDTSMIVRGGDKIGIYFCEKGASQRSSKVIYDRKHSSFAESSGKDFHWASLFDGADWFHFTGITPALSDALAHICLEAAREARTRGIFVSCDINFRKKLWSRDKACAVMSELCNYVDYCIINEEDAKDVFGIEAENSDISGGKLDRNGYISVAEQLTHRFAFQGVAITLRKSNSASENGWSGLFYTQEKAYFSREYTVHIVDRVGGGDSFAAGFIYALRSGVSAQEVVDFAVAASCLKHSIEGDFNLVSLEEINTLAHGDASGRVQR